MTGTGHQHDTDWGRDGAVDSRNRCLSTGSLEAGFRESTTVAMRRSRPSDCNQIANRRETSIMSKRRRSTSRMGDWTPKSLPTESTTPITITQVDRELILADSGRTSSRRRINRRQIALTAPVPPGKSSSYRVDTRHQIVECVSPVGSEELSPAQLLYPPHWSRPLSFRQVRSRQRQVGYRSCCRLRPVH